MHHEIVGPEQNLPGRNIRDNSLSGKLHIPKDLAIARHVAQYSTNFGSATSGPSERFEKSEHEKAEEIKAEKIEGLLEAFVLTKGDFQSRLSVKKMLENVGIPEALAENWQKRQELANLMKIKRQLNKSGLTLSVSSMEGMDADRLTIEMDAMINVLGLSRNVADVVRKAE